MKDPRIALISEEFPPFTFGGVGSVCDGLAHSLSRKKVSTTVFCRGSGKIVIEKPNDSLEIIRLPSLNLPPRSLWFQLQNLSNFSKLLRNYDVFHVVSPSSGTFCVNLKEKLATPLVTSVHGLIWRELEILLNAPVPYWTLGEFAFSFAEFPVYHFLDKRIIQNSDHVVSCSYTLLEDLRRICGNSISRKASVIYNGLDIESIDNILEDEKGGIQNDFSIFNWGRLYWVKGVFYLLKAIANLKRDFPAINLKISGTGPLMGKIKRQIASLKIESNVRLMGYLPRTDLIKEIKRANVVVLPSLSEASPIAVFESMACKKAPIVFDFPFSREYVVNMHNGLLAKAKDEQDLSDKIRLLLTDQKLRLQLGSNAYGYVRKHHNWDTVVEKYISLYELLS